jgi:hypothetical protein
MSAEIKTDMAIQEPHKSKRLSSFIWILVLWGFVRLIAGMDGISWTRVFWITAHLLGALPASLLLLCAVVFPLRYQTMLRWASLGAFFLGIFATLFIGIYFQENSAAFETPFFFLRQLVYPFFVLAWALTRTKDFGAKSWLI